MDSDSIAALLKEALQLDEVYVNGEGSHFQVIAVSDMFSGMSRVKQQQILYKPLMEYIADNRIHAVNFRVFTPDVWLRERKLMGL